MISGTGRGREEEARTLNIYTYIKITYIYIYKLNVLMVINTIIRQFICSADIFQTLRTLLGAEQI